MCNFKPTTTLSEQKLEFGSETPCDPRGYRQAVGSLVYAMMLKLTQLCRANKLSINFKKSNFMIFRPRQRRQTLDISIQIDNNVIERVKESVFLGVILDEHLSWKLHLLSVCRKISKSIGIIYKSSFCLPKASLRSLYYSLVYPYLIYCVSVWGSTY